jgi:hypothetical protein
LDPPTLESFSDSNSSSSSSSSSDSDSPPPLGDSLQIHERSVLCFWFAAVLFSFVFHFPFFPLARFNCTPASSCIFFLISPGKHTRSKERPNEASVPKPAAARGGGSSGGGGGGSGV